MALDITLNTLLATKTKAEVQTEIEAYAESKNLPVSSWTNASLPKILISAYATLLEDFYTLRRNIAAIGFLDTATEDGLSLLGFNVYGLERTPEEYAQGTIVLTDTTGAGPYNISAGRLWIQSDSGFKFNNTTEGVLSRYGTLSLTFKAESPGVTYNSVGAGSAWDWVGSPLVGVEITNPEIIVGSGTWLTIQGRDVESDDLFRERCRDRWPSSGLGMTADAWQYHALQSSASVTRVKVISNPNSTPGLTGIIIAGVDGELSPTVVTEVDTYLQPKKTLTTTVSVSSAINKIIAVAGTVYVKADYLAEVVNRVHGNEVEGIESVLKTLQRTIEIGSDVYKSKIVCALQDILSDVEAVTHVILTSPVEVTSLLSNEIAFLEFNNSTLIVEVG